MQAIKILNMIKVHGKPIRVNKASQDKKQQDVGANLFIGNLDPDVDEKVQDFTIPLGPNASLAYCRMLGCLLMCMLHAQMLGL